MFKRLIRKMDGAAAAGVWVATFCAFSCPVFCAEAVGEELPPGYSVARTGDMHDFDYFVGAWTTHQKRLKSRGVGASDWEEFPATQCLSLYLGGLATVDELYMPTRNRAGLTLRTFDVSKRQW